MEEMSEACWDDDDDDDDDDGDDNAEDCGHDEFNLLIKAFTTAPRVSVSSTSNPLMQIVFLFSCMLESAFDNVGGEEGDVEEEEVLFFFRALFFPVGS